MSEKKDKKDELEERFDQLIQDEIKFTITTALQYYQTLNLKRLAKLIGKPESSTIRYLKQMLDEGLIEIDAEKTASSWGKFYKLAPKIKEIAERKRSENEERLEEIRGLFPQFSDMDNSELSKIVLKDLLQKSDIENLDLLVKQNIAFNSNLQKLIANEFCQAHEYLMKEVGDRGLEFMLENVELIPSDVSFFTGTIDLFDFKQLFRFLDKIFIFVDEINELKAQFKKEMDEANIPDEERITHQVQLFTGSLDYGGKIRKEKKK